MNNIKYICCRWRDAITDPPPAGWRGLIRNTDDGPGAWFRDYRGRHYPGDQWLDVTDTPAVPRADVQAAVDEIAVAQASADRGETWHGRRDYAEPIRRHTGITPTVTP